MKRSPFILARWILVAALAAALSGVTAVAVAGETRFGVLYDADGVTETYAYCASCHSERIVAQQGLSRRHWAELLDDMVEEQGMVELAEPVRTRILDYLAEHYGEDRPNFAAPE